MDIDDSQPKFQCSIKKHRIEEDDVVDEEEWTGSEEDSQENYVNQTAINDESDNDSGFLNTSTDSLNNIEEEVKNHEFLPNVSSQSLSSGPNSKQVYDFLEYYEKELLKGNENAESNVEQERDLMIKKLGMVFKELPDCLLEMIIASVRCGDCGRPADETPDWLDMDKFRRGQKFARDHLAGVYLAEMMSLFQLFSFKDGLRPLVVSRKSHTPYLAFKRYLSTALRVRNWYTEDPWTKGTNAYNDIQTVRKMHMSIRRRLCKSSNEEIKQAGSLPGAYCPMRDMVIQDSELTCPVPSLSQCPYMIIEDSEKRPKGMNQAGMSFTQYGFVNLVILYPQAFGVHHATDEDLEAFCHLWRGLGYLLGIEDEYNFCRGNLEEIRLKSRHINEFWVKRNLRMVTPEWEHMLRCVIEGIGYYFPGSTYETSLLYLSELLNVEMPQLYQSLGYMKWMRYHVDKYIFNYVCKIPGFISHLNKILNNAMDRAKNYTEEKHEELQKKSDNSPLNIIL